MASFRAIAAVSRAIQGLLENACPKDEFPLAQFELYQESNFTKPMDEGISIFLFRLAVNSSMRNLPPRIAPDGTRYRPSLPLDLHYIITPWAPDVQRQQRLLGWAMRTLEDTPILPSGLLNHFVPEPDTFASNENVELICDPLSLQDWVTVWDKLKSRLQTSVTYTARMVLLDSDLGIAEGITVLTRVFDHRQGPRT
jgi:hypothetical protein